MPLDPILARGTTPLLEGVPNTLYQIAAMREARARDQEFARRTALYEQTAADERKLRLEDRQLALEDREKAERTRRLKEILPLVEAGDPAAISDHPARRPRFRC